MKAKHFFFIRVSIFLFFGSLALASSNAAGVRTWDGGASGANANWATAANWDANTAPLAGDFLMFPAGPSKQTVTNNFPVNRLFGGFGVSDKYILRGNAVNLTSQMQASFPGSATVDFDIGLQSAVTFDSFRGAAITLNGRISLNDFPATFDGLAGNQFINGVIVDVPGSSSRVIITGRETQLDRGRTTVVLNGTNNCPGPTLVTNVSELVVNGSVTSQVAVAASAVLSGKGVIGSLTASGKVSPGDQDPGRLTISRACTFAASSTFSVRLAGSNPGVTYDQLRCSNTVSLASAHLQILPDAQYIPSVGTIFTILNKTSTGAINGEFADLPQGASTNVNGVIYQISYVGGTGNDVTLTVTSLQLSPGGNATGILTGRGTLAFNAVSSLNLQLTNAVPGVGFDQLIISNGNLSLGSATLNLTAPANIGEVVGASFMVVKLDSAPLTQLGTVSGTFAGLPEGAETSAGPLRLRISYHGGDGNDVTLTITGVVPTGVSRTYVGPTSGNSFWTLDANWSPRGRPNQGDTLLFASPGNNRTITNDLPPGTSFDQISLDDIPVGGLRGILTLKGNPLRLERGISAQGLPNIATTSFTVDLPLALNADQTFHNEIPDGQFGILTLGNIALDGHALTFDHPFGSTISIAGTISGAGSGSRLIKASAADLAITGNHTYEGATLLNAGKLILNGQFASPVTASPGTVLDARGRIGGLTLTSSTLEIGASDPDLSGIASSDTFGDLQITGALSFDSAATWHVHLGSRNLPFAVDRLTCNSSVNLGGATLALNASQFAQGDISYQILTKTAAGDLTGTFAGRPEGAEFLVNGRFYSISYHGGDGNDVVIISTNKPPALVQVPNQTIIEQIPFTLNIDASNPEPNESLAFSLDPGSPTGASIESAGFRSGRLSWTPTEDQGPGVYNVTVRATDSGIPSKNATMTFQITVLDTNLPPVISVPALINGNESNLISFAVSAFDPDSPPASLIYELLQPYPSGMTLTSTSSATALVTWTPTEEQGPSRTTVKIKVTENATTSLSSTAAVTVVVNEVNVPPSPQPVPDTNVLAGSTLMMQLTAVDPDLPANTLTWRGSLPPPLPTTTLPNGASISGTGLFTYTPASTDSGVRTITVYVSDGSQFSSVSFKVRIEISRLVTNTSDSGPGSLRQAILDVNNNTGGGRIGFNISGTAPFKISPLSPLPLLSRAMVIDAYTQPGSQRNTRTDGNDARIQIELSGEQLPGSTGLVCNVSGVTVRGLCLNRWGSATATSAGAAVTNAIVEGCFIGTDPKGIINRPNTNGIVFSKSFGGRIGGPTPTQHNLISGNAQAGILLAGSSPDSFLHNLTIQGNLIGTDLSGTNPLGNGTFGIVCQTNVAMTNLFVADNVISANLQGGLLLAGARNIVVRNKLGLGADGIASLGNGNLGVELVGNQHSVGGRNLADANIIANNGGPGVHVADGTGHSLLGNSIFGNFGLAIDLGAFGPDGNDPGDADAGPNNLQNKPILTSVTLGASGPATVSGLLHSVSSTSYHIEFFHSSDFTPANQPQARAFIGSLEVMTDENGTATFAALVLPPLPNGLITATATDSAGNTSEISKGIGLGGATVPAPFVPPRLRIARVANNSLLLNWVPTPVNIDPLLFPDFQLQTSQDLIHWSNFGLPVRGGLGVNLPEQNVSLPADTPPRFFRLLAVVNMTNTDFAGQDLRGAPLSGANLVGANFTDSFLMNVDFSNADLRGADFTGANLDGALLDGANLSRVTIDSYRGAFDLSQLGGKPDDPIATSIPNIMYYPRAEDYAVPNPDVPQISLSHNILSLSFNDGVSVPEANQVIRRVLGTIVGGIAGRTNAQSGSLILRLPIQTHLQMNAVRELLSSIPSVHTALPDLLNVPQTIPSRASQFVAAPAWNWHDTNTLLNAPGLPPGTYGNWGHRFARIPQMWNLNASIDQNPAFFKIGIIDEQFRFNHPDLILDDSLVSNTSSGSPQHGTEVAGVLAAVFDNESGMEGVNPYSRTLALAENINISAFALEKKLVEQAVRNGAAIINISLGQHYGGNQPTPSVKDLMRERTKEVITLMGSLAEPPLIVTSAGNDAVEAQFNNPWACAVINNLVDNILVVENLQLRADGSVELNGLSNTGGTISAPGTEIITLEGDPGISALYRRTSGTSVAAPFVSGVAGFLKELDPGLTAPELIRCLKQGANHNLPQGVAVAVDGFAAALSIDLVRGDVRILRRLLDVDDRTLDGNQRVNPMDGSDFINEGAVTFGGLGDGQINISDFRRWRDWLLQAENAPGLSLDGSPQHPKKDLNGDGVFGDQDENGDGTITDNEKEKNLWPRGDFNGDGIIDRATPAPVPGFLGGAMLTDFQVLTNLFQDPDYTSSELDLLIDSCDFHVDVSQMFENPLVSKVSSSVFQIGGSIPLRTFEHSPTKLEFIHTVPISGIGYTLRAVALDASGNSLCEETTNFPSLGPGADRFWEPICVDVRIEPGSATVVVGHALQFDAHVTGSRDKAVTWAATGGTIDGNGRFTAGNKAGDFVVTATSVADPSKFDIAAVTIYDCALDIRPSQVSLRPRDTFQFNTTVEGMAAGPIIWSVTGAGNIDSNGRFTAGDSDGAATVHAEIDGCRPATATVWISHCALINKSACYHMEYGIFAGPGENAVCLNVEHAPGCGTFNFSHFRVDQLDPPLQLCCGGITWDNIFSPKPNSQQTAVLTYIDPALPQEPPLTLKFTFRMGNHNCTDPNTHCQTGPTSIDSDSFHCGITNCVDCVH